MVSYGEKTEVHASYQNATYIYLQREKLYYRALLITRTNSSSAVSVAGLSPTDEITFHALWVSNRGGSLWGKAEMATGYPLTINIEPPCCHKQRNSP